MPQMIPDIKTAWKYPSVNGVALAMAFQAALTANPQALSFLPEQAQHAITLALLVWAAYDRLITHPPQQEPAP